MSFKNRVIAALKQQASTSGGIQPPPVCIEEGEGRFVIEVVEIGSLACSFDRITYTSKALQSASLAALTQMAEDIQRRVSYLLEAIRPIEVDEDRCVVQMRSNPPAKDDDGTRYYELVVQRGEVSLCRFCKTPGQPRRRVPAEVTHEVVGRLAADFAQQ
jgi:hypothetical protein